MNTFLADHISREIQYAESVIERFTEDLKVDPDHAFCWADSAMKAAATRQVWMQIRDFASEDCASASMVQGLAVSFAAALVESSSGSASLMYRYRMTAWAKAAEKLADIEKHCPAEAA